MHTSWSRFCTVNHQALASNYQLSNMKCPGPRFKLATSKDVGKHSHRPITECHVKEVKVGILCPIQQPGSHWYRCTACPITLNHNYLKKHSPVLGTEGHFVTDQFLSCGKFHICDSMPSCKLQDHIEKYHKYFPHVLP